MKVLIVDDTRVNRMVLARMVKKLGIGSFSHAVDGRDAVQQAQAGDFDVIFMVRQGTAWSREMYIASPRALPVCFGCTGHPNAQHGRH